MNSTLRPLASLRVTLVGMLFLAIGVALSYNDPAQTPQWVVAAPMALLVINLLAAILINPSINRRAGLLLFHIGLLGIVVLAGVGRLTHFEGHVELLQDAAFSPAEVIDLRAAPLHTGHLDRVVFVQGPYTVDYAPGVVRGRTRSVVYVPDEHGGLASRVIGDDTPLVIDGYRFYTSFNKGFAPILTWTPDHGTPQTGAVHMPPYPLFEFKQDNKWAPPGGPEIRFWLRLDTGLREDAAWVLDGEKAKGVLVVNSGERRVELQPGESVRLAGGNLRYERLSTWMGYKIFYDPTLRWMFGFSLIGILGLADHFRRKFAVHWPAAVTGRRDERRACPTAR